MTRFATIRKYSSAPLLSDELIKRQEDMTTVLKQIRGFHAFYLLKTSDGPVTMTVCEDKAGTDESNRVTDNWLKDKLPTFASRAPEIMTGEVKFELEPQLVHVKP